MSKSVSSLGSGVMDPKAYFQQVSVPGELVNMPVIAINSSIPDTEYVNNWASALNSSARLTS